MASASGPSRLQWYTKWYTGGLFSLNPTVRIGMDVWETVGMAKRGLRLVKWIDDAPSLI